MAGDAVLENWVTRDALAAELGVTPETMAKWATRGEGPPFVRVGRKVFYRRTAVRKWLEKMERKSSGPENS